MIPSAFSRIALLVTALLAGALAPAMAGTYASVEPIPNEAIPGAGALQNERLAVREEFAREVLECGLPVEIIDALGSTGAIPTINPLNTSLGLAAGGFAGATNPTYVFTFLDEGPNAARRDDIAVLVDALGFALSQGSVFLLDADDPGAFDFPANYLVVNFPAPPAIEESAALFEAVGRIDPALFSTDTSGYTQIGRAYLAVQPDVDAQRFIAGYVRATEELGLEYTPRVGGVASLFVGGVAFPGNDWTSSPGGEEYLARIPAGSHEALSAIRARHLRFAERFLHGLPGDGAGDAIGYVRSRLSRAQCP